MSICSIKQINHGNTAKLFWGDKSRRCAVLSGHMSSPMYLVRGGSARRRNDMLSIRCLSFSVDSAFGAESTQNNIACLSGNAACSSKFHTFRLKGKILSLHLYGRCGLLNFANDMKETAFPFSRPLYVMLKPAGAHCNMACTYCYYLEKAKLYEQEPKQIMTDETLERFTKDYIEAQTMEQVLFTWHGGEPLMRPLAFYKKALELQRKYARGRRIDNCIQTNGTLLNDEWCRFLHDNGWLVGISIDGPQEFHDEYRRNRGGRPSFMKVMNGIRLLNKWQVEWNAMAVVNDYNADYPDEFYQFFKQIGCQYIQFAPIVERITHHADGRHLATLTDDGKDCELADFSVTPEQWGKFLCRLFDLWVVEDVGRVFIQIFDATLANWAGVQPGICTMGRECGHAAVMMHNGDVYSCDHFVFPEYKLGNIHSQTLVEMLYGEKQRQFAEMKQRKLTRRCRECRWLFACNGECPKNRFVNAHDGEPGENYLCRGFQMFFEHVAPYMDFMKHELDEQRPPANVMEAIKAGKLPRPVMEI